MSTSIPVLPAFDGVCFLGGGVQCTAQQYAGIAAILCKLNMAVEDFFTGIQYVSGSYHSWLAFICSMVHTSVDARRLVHT